MKVALITDSHLGVRNDSVLFNDYQAEFYEKIFFPELVKRDIKTIIHLGDIMDRRRYINFSMVDRFKEHFLDKLVEHDIFMHLIVGNHDCYYKNTNRVNSPDILFGDYKDRINIVSDDVYAYTDNIALVPWINPENQDKLFSQLNESKPNVLLGHFEFAGFEMTPGHTIDHGFSTSRLTEFEMILSGHYHHKSTKDNITYLGSPFEYTWSDYDDPKGFHIFDTETLDLERIINPDKMFHKITYNDESANPDPTQDFSKYKDRIVKLVVSRKTDESLFDQFYSALLAAGPFDVQVIDLEIVYTDTELTEEEIENKTKDTKEYLLDYIESLSGIQDTTKETTKELLRNLYVEAQAEV